MRQIGTAMSSEIGHISGGQEKAAAFDARLSGGAALLVSPYRRDSRTGIREVHRIAFDADESFAGKDCRRTGGSASHKGVED